MLRVLAVLSLALAPAWQLHAQFMPQLPRDEASLIRLLQSDQQVFTQAKACQRLAVVGTEAAVPALKPLLQHPQLTAYARTALQRIPGRAAEDALVAAIDSLQGELLAGVLHSIGQRRIERASTALTDLVRQPDQSDGVRVAALRSLGEIGNRDAAAFLIDYAGNAPSGPVREAAAGALLTAADRALQRDDVELARSLLERIEQTAPKSAAARAAEQQRLLLASDDNPEQLRQALRSDSEYRFRAALQVARHIGSAAAPVIAGSLKSLPPDRQSLALRCLADLGERSVSEQVLPLVESSEQEVAQSAVVAAVRLGHWDDADQLPEVATTNSPIARFTLGELATIGNERLDAAVVDHLEKLAAGKGDLPQPAARGMIEYTAARHVTAATEPLLKLTRASGSPFRDAALRAAGATTSVEHFPALLRRLQDSGAGWSQEDIDEAIAQATVRLPQAAAAEAIAQVMQDASTEQNVRLLDYLARLGGDRALEIVAEAARSGEDAMVDAATRVLGEWLTADVAGTLGPLVRDLDNSRYRRRVLRGYLRVGRQLDMPIETRMDLAADAHQLARRDEERRLALDILRRYPSLQGLTWLAEQIRSERPSSPSHRADQYRTLAAVAERVAEDQPQQVRQTLENFPLEHAPKAPAATLRVLREGN